jgi:hypothetical protein
MKSTPEGGLKESEIRWLQTCVACKGGSPPKKTTATWEYEVGGLKSRVPFRITGRGVHGHGELKGLKPEGEGKPNSPQPSLTVRGWV